MDHEEIGRAILDAAFRVHSVLGPGLLEGVYEVCLAHELAKRMPVTRQVIQPVRYDGLEIETGYRLDLLVADKVVVELKTVDKITDLHLAQLLSYLKLGEYKLGFLINFNVLRLKDGIKRVVNGL